MNAMTWARWRLSPPRGSAMSSRHQRNGLDDLETAEAKEAGVD